MANKKHIRQENEEKQKESDLKTEGKSDKAGVENKAFETDEKGGDKNEAKYTARNSADQSQIEMGFTESMMCTNKMQN